MGTEIYIDPLLSPSQPKHVKSKNKNISTVEQACNNTFEKVQAKSLMCMKLKKIFFPNLIFLAVIQMCFLEEKKREKNAIWLHLLIKNLAFLKLRCIQNASGTGPSTYSSDSGAKNGLFFYIPLKIDQFILIK